MKGMIKTPEKTDILFGRDAESWNHEGNRAFRALVAKHQDEYHACNVRMKKVGIVAKIVNQLTEQGCRFLKRDHRLSAWFVVDRKACIEKVGHAIRDKQVIAQRGMDKKQPKQQSMVDHHNPQGKEIHASVLSNADIMQRAFQQHHHHPHVGGAGNAPTAIPFSDLVRQDRAQRQYLDLIASARLARIQQTSQAELDALRKLAATEEILATMKRKRTLEQELEYLRSRSRVMAILERGTYLPQQGAAAAAATAAAAAVATMNFNPNRSLSLVSTGRTVPESLDVLALRSALASEVRSMSAESQSSGVNLRALLGSSLPF